MILPNIISALELSAQLYLLPMYRLAMVMLSGVLLIMEGTDFASKALAQVVEIWDQVLVSGDIETIALGWLVQGKAKIDLGLGNCDDDERTNMTLLGGYITGMKTDIQLTDRRRCQRGSRQSLDICREIGFEKLGDPDKFTTGYAGGILGRYSGTGFFREDCRISEKRLAQ